MSGRLLIQPKAEYRFVNYQHWRTWLATKQKFVLSKYNKLHQPIAISKAGQMDSRIAELDL